MFLLLFNNLDVWPSRTQNMETSCGFKLTTFTLFRTRFREFLEVSSSYTFMEIILNELQGSQNGQRIFKLKALFCF